MTEDIFTRLEPEMLRTLLRANPAFQVPMILVDSTLHILSCNEQAKHLLFMSLIPSTNEWLSPSAQEVLEQFFADQSKKPYSLLEWQNGAEYQLEIFPHAAGALLVFYHEEHTSYDGSLRVMQLKTTEVLNALVIQIDQMKSAATQSKEEMEKIADLQKQCLRLFRLIKHMELLHEPPDPTMLFFESSDVADLCRHVIEKVQTKTPCTFTSHLPHSCFLSINTELVKTALYNLLVNAVQVSDKKATIQVSLHNTPQYTTITVADQGNGLTARQFEALLYGWKRVSSHRNYIAEQFGFGLPVAQLVARLHDGQLLFSPREGGGNAIHFSLGHSLHFNSSNRQEMHEATQYMSQVYSLEETELSAL